MKKKPPSGNGLSIRARVRKTGIFKLNSAGVTEDVYQLTPQKGLSKMNPWEIPILQAYHLEAEATAIIDRYLKDQRSLEDYVIAEEERSLEESLRKYVVIVMRRHELSRTSLEPQLNNLLEKAKKQLRSNIRNSKIYSRKVKQRRNKKIDEYERLINPLFKAFLRALPKINKTDCMRYVAILLTGVGLKQCTGKGYKTLFERFRKYYQRKH